MMTGSLITRGLEGKGFEVAFINRLEPLRDTLRTVRPHALLLDLEIGERDSREELPAVRTEYPSLPIIVLTSHHIDSEVTRCYEAGATCCLAKPFGINELERIIRHLIPGKSGKESGIRLGAFRLDTRLGMLLWGEKKISLNPKECLLLRLLSERRGELVSRQQILREVWHNEEAGASLNNYITYLRRHLRDDPSIRLTTVNGRGYILEWE